MFSDGGNGTMSDAAEGLVGIERRQVGGGRIERGALRLVYSEARSSRQERESRRRKGDGRMARDEKRESEMGDGDGGASVWRGFQGCINVRGNGVQPQEVKLQEAGQSKGRWISSSFAAGKRDTRRLTRSCASPWLGACYCGSLLGEA